MKLFTFVSLGLSLGISLNAFAASGQNHITYTPDGYVVKIAESVQSESGAEEKAEATPAQIAEEALPQILRKPVMVETAKIEPEIKKDRVPDSGKPAPVPAPAQVKPAPPVEEHPEQI